MNDLQSERQSDQLSRYLGYSAIFHVALVALFVLKAVIYPSEPLVLERSIKVDLVGLPDKMRAPPKPPAGQREEAKPKDPPKPEAKPQPVAEAAKPTPPPAVATPPPLAVKRENKPSLDINKSKQAQDSALKRLEALSRIEKMAAQDRQAQPARGEPDSESSQPIRGNVLSPGSSLTGIHKLDHDEYLDRFNDHVKKHWSLPDWLAHANLSARVRVFLDERGYVLKRQVIQSSNNPMFDERVLAAVDAAQPFPVPPDKFKAILSVDGLVLGFPE